MIFLTTFFNFWRYKMKKTILAMAVASVVAAPAMADVSISGKVEQEFISTDSTVAASDQVQQASDAKLVFSASEDLGEGLSAFASATLDTDTIGTTQDVKVGLTGGMGTIVLGRMEDFTESKVQSMIDVMGGSGGSVELDQTADRNNGGFAYVSPTFNGFTVGLAGYAIASGTSTDDDTFDATDIMVSYANGPMTVAIAREKINATTVTALTGTDADINTETTSLGMKYAEGDLSVALVYSDAEDSAGTAANDHNDLIIAGTYNIGGSNSIAIGWNENELTTGATDNNTTSVEVRHNFSGRTRAYVGAAFDDFANTANETDTFYLGLEHSF